VDVAGVRVPVSPTHGPRFLDAGRAAGYTHDAAGAALAAVQVLTRTSPTVAPEVYQPILAEQLTGPNVEALERRLRTAGRPGVASNDATVPGYLITDFRPGSPTAVVDVLLTATSLPAGQAVDLTVSLQWSDDDWRVLAPPDGGWGAVASILTALPPGRLDYAQVG
jgi:hypothetical protein